MCGNADSRTRVRRPAGMRLPGDPGGGRLIRGPGERSAAAAEGDHAPEAVPLRG